ncbi:hypothetical protein CAT37_12065 [Acinetobacter pittii]|uniref:hypothetical protein n=1 Tax=Acinetobacter pittii TaxID=48296 RepID=UPI000A3C70F1|nr:hypothetical protein [Acinetobacter pittii]OTU43087.1 hypothetical protein CAT37_12065 [Acinetobacter pittii]QRQ11794.1 hypothetical protein I6J46_11350 [Acinetobacter pittii]
MDKNFSDPLANTFTDVHQAMSFGEAKNKSFLSKVLGKIRRNNCEDAPLPFPHCDLGTWRW